MTKAEFLNELKETLANELNPSEVDENVRYYMNYMEEQMRLGYSEAQVLSDLGDPRSIAHNIIDGIEMSREKNGANNSYVKETYYEDGVSQTQLNKRQKIKSYAVLIGILVLVCMVLILVTKLILFALPIVLGIAVIVWILKKIDGR